MTDKQISFQLFFLLLGFQKFQYFQISCPIWYNLLQLTNVSDEYENKSNNMYHTRYKWIITSHKRFHCSKKWFIKIRACMHRQKTNVKDNPLWWYSTFHRLNIKTCSVEITQFGFIFSFHLCVFARIRPTYSPKIMRYIAYLDTNALKSFDI